MPEYAYACKCGKRWKEFRMIAEGQPEKCDACGAKYGEGLEQDYSLANHVVHSYLDPKTFGQQSERNVKAMPKTLVDEANAKAKEAAGPLPWWRDGSCGERMDKPLNLDKVKDRQKYIEHGEKS